MRLPPPPDRYDREYERERNRTLEQADAENVKHEGKRVYAASNVTTDRTFDADATSTAELADIVGTLIADLREKKIIG
jgi:hypothetical protein